MGGSLTVSHLYCNSYSIRQNTFNAFFTHFSNELLRLKVELETCHAEDRMEAVRHAHEEHIADVNQLKENFAFREQMLRDEIGAVKSQLSDRNRRLDEANEKADKQIMQIRMILNKSEQDHQREINAQISQHENEIRE